MNQQQTTGETDAFDSPIQGYPFGVINIIPDHSAEIFAAVIHDKNLLPDDRDEIVNERISSSKIKRSRTPEVHLSEKAKARLNRRPLALIQEEHALWLK